jgi:hypothetical protein
MAAFLRVLAGLIPWADVVKSAPAILAAAKDLIEGAPKQRPPEPSPPPSSEAAPSSEELKRLRAEAGQLRAYIVELQADSRRQAEVIERLAEQADRLVAGLDDMRKWVRIVFGVAVFALVLSAACLASFFLR